MLLKALLGLATVTHAFLVVPGITEPEGGAVEALKFKPPHTAEKQTLELSCPGCPLEIKKHGGGVRVKTDKASHLLLDFAIEAQPDGDRLTVNGFALYPAGDPFSQVLTAPHLPDHKRKHHGDGQDKNDRHSNKKHHGAKKFSSPALGYSLRVNPVATDKDMAMDLLSIDFQVIEVGNTFVDDIPNVHIKCIKTSDNKLMIGSIETTPSQNPPTSPKVKQEDCTTLLCRWRAVFEEQISKLKPFKQCGGNKGSGAKASSSGKEDGAPWRPHHHHHHHSKHRKHSWGQLFKNIASHIVLPVLIGIMAGVACSLFGMVVGTCIVGFWRSFFRHHHPRRAGRAAHKAAKKEASLAEEKSGLMEHQDPPPKYQDEDTKPANV